MLSHMTFWPMPWPWMLIFPLVGLVIMVLLAILCFRRGGWMSRCMGRQENTDAGSDRRESAMDVLKRRYAAGEISQEEFERIKQDIE
ncbi:MAG: SHOCT domain-containing protein [Phycisphaerae bacterium]